MRIRMTTTIIENIYIKDWLDKIIDKSKLFED